MESITNIFTNKSKVTSNWANDHEKKDVDASSAYLQKLKKGNIHDFAKMYSESQTCITGGGTIW